MMSSGNAVDVRRLAMLAGETVSSTFECVLEEELLVGVDDPVLADTAALVELELVVPVARRGGGGGGGSRRAGRECRARAWRR